MGMPTRIARRALASEAADREALDLHERGSGPGGAALLIRQG